MPSPAWEMWWSIITSFMVNCAYVNATPALLYAKDVAPSLAQSEENAAPAVEPIAESEISEPMMQIEPDKDVIL